MDEQYTQIAAIASALRTVKHLHVAFVLELPRGDELTPGHRVPSDEREAGRTESDQIPRMVAIARASDDPNDRANRDEDQDAR